MLKFKKQNFWYNKPQLDVNESLLFEVPANHSQGRRAVSGKLFVTNHRILFVPNRIDAVMGGRCKELPVQAVSNIAVAEPVFSLLEIFSGALRKRLCITIDHSVDDFFVVNHLNEILARFRNHGIPQTS